MPPLYPRKETLHPLYWRLGEPQGWSGWMDAGNLATAQDHPACGKSLYYAILTHFSFT